MDRYANAVREALNELGLYHSFRLPDGRILPGANALSGLEERLDKLGIPPDLTGLRVLDIGPWDGYCTFALEQRGAEVTAIDYVDLDTFRILHRAYQSRATYLHLDVYQLDPARHGLFDIVLCFGVLYHLKHPLLALEKICAVTRGTCYLDTFVVDAPEHEAGRRPRFPYAEFYERDELAGQLDNWTGPTVGVVEAWVRSAGFARAEYRGATSTTARVAAHRHWQLAAPALPPVHVTAVTSHRHPGNSFYTVQEEYVCLWSDSFAEPPALDEIHPEVAGFGVAPLACSAVPGGVVVSLPLPPGLAPGTHQVRLRIGAHDWSAAWPIHVDLPDWPGPVELLAAQDALSAALGQVDWQTGGWLTLWLRGLSPESGRGNVCVYVGEVPHEPLLVLWQERESAWQVNVRLRPCVGAQQTEARVEHRGARSNAVGVVIRGEAPTVKGLEGL